MIQLALNPSKTTREGLRIRTPHLMWPDSRFNGRRNESRCLSGRSPVSALSAERSGRTRGPPLQCPPPPSALLAQSLQLAPVIRWYIHVGKHLPILPFDLHDIDGVRVQQPSNPRLTVLRLKL